MNYIDLTIKDTAMIARTLKYHSTAKNVVKVMKDLIAKTIVEDRSECIGFSMIEAGKILDLLKTNPDRPIPFDDSDEIESDTKKCIYAVEQSIIKAALREAEIEAEEMSDGLDLYIFNIADNSPNEDF